MYFFSLTSTLVVCIGWRILCSTFTFLVTQTSDTRWLILFSQYILTFQKILRRCIIAKKSSFYIMRAVNFTWQLYRHYSFARAFSLRVILKRFIILIIVSFSIFASFSSSRYFLLVQASHSDCCYVILIFLFYSFIAALTVFIII